MVPPPASHRFDGRRLRRWAGDGGLDRTGGPLAYGKIRHEDTSNAVKPIRRTVDTVATAT